MRVYLQATTIKFRIEKLNLNASKYLSVLLLFTI